MRSLKIAVCISIFLTVTTMSVSCRSSSTTSGSAEFRRQVSTEHPSPTRTPSAQNESISFKVENILKRSDVIWGFDFLPSGQIVLTERGGKIVVFSPDSGTSQVIRGTPTVYAVGQGGMLDIRVHPQFSQNHLVYFAYAEPVAGKATTAIARARLEGKELRNFQKLFSADAPSSNTIHFGSRIEFDRKGHFFFTVGDRNERPKVQDLGFHNGSFMRLNDDGSVPTDNPFVGQAGARPEIWSYGHRSPQGLAMRPGTDELWSSEMGPLGGDEINLIKRGANYGWPIVTYGREYSGEPIGEGTEKAGMENPIAYWVPSISPSGIGFYSGDRFPGWKGNLFIGTLSGTHLRRIVLNGTKVVSQEVLLDKLGARIRCVHEGPDGYLYFSTDAGELSRLVPET